MPEIKVFERTMTLTDEEHERFQGKMQKLESMAGPDRIVDMPVDIRNFMALLASRQGVGEPDNFFAFDWVDAESDDQSDAESGDQLDAESKERFDALLDTTDPTIVMFNGIPL